jgi:hypothetical protein
MWRLTRSVMIVTMTAMALYILAITSLLIVKALQWLAASLFGAPGTSGG